MCHMPPSQFPKLAEILEISAYDFGKSLEILRQLELPSALQLHLLYVDDLILEEHAWKMGSSLLEVCRLLLLLYSCS